MLNQLPLAIAIVLIVLLGAWWVTPTNSASSDPQTVARSSDADASAASQTNASDATDVTASSEPQPKVEVERTEYNFGSMERFEKSSHTFTIRNVGDAPLQLEVGDSSCSCTLAGLEEAGVAPGEETHIKLEWTLKFKEGPFRQSATILTNDPNRREVQFF
ncbi:MAG: DUF1573 domain-containing protein, partial [Blastopirellula sp. JB062]